MKTKIALFACAMVCMVGMLVLPVSAAIGQPSGNPINESLKNDLWNVHAHHRLAAFENNVNSTGGAIAVLNQYNYDTTILGAIHKNISGKHDALQTALQNEDRDQLRTINTELKGQWKDFGKEMRQLIRNSTQTA